ncbi:MULTISPECIES: flagellar biosynthetic protein FliO [Paraliobacillus]|uniref:flagellar biosynthetic protein FliO n=1 Tax=Paraliobacillus TaxID=200903 RepID=UPI000DD2D1BA|nr:MULTISPECIES: flagellar biosynthetic protein FliO [Paraliobacillus]
MKNMRKINFVCLLIALFTWASIPSTMEAASNDGYVDDLFKNEAPSDETDSPEEENENSESNPSSETSLSENSVDNPIITFLKIVLSLILILGLMYLLLKLFNKKTKLYKHANTLENIGGVPLGSNKSIQMIRIGDSIFVVGVADNIELLTEITDEETKKQLLESQTEQASSNQIANVIGKTISRVSSKKQQVTSTKSPAEFSSLFKNELNGLADKRKKITEQYKRKEEDKHE